MHPVTGLALPGNITLPIVYFEEYQTARQAIEREKATEELETTMEDRTYSKIESSNGSLWYG